MKCCYCHKNDVFCLSKNKKLICVECKIKEKRESSKNKKLNKCDDDDDYNSGWDSV